MRFCKIQQKRRNIADVSISLYFVMYLVFFLIIVIVLAATYPIDRYSLNSDMLKSSISEFVWL